MKNNQKQRIFLEELIVSARHEGRILKAAHKKGVITDPGFNQQLLQCADYQGIFSPIMQ